MKSFALLCFCLILSVHTFAQRYDSLTNKATGTADSVNLKLEKASNRVDSIQQKLAQATTLPELPDSLLPSFQKVDSIRQQFNKEATAIQEAYNDRLSSIDASSATVKKSIDSLQNLKLPVGKEQRKLDSLNNLRETTATKFNSRLDSLKAKTTGKLDALDLPPQYKEPVQGLTSKINSAGLKSETLKVPGLKIPGYKLPEVGDISDLASKAGNVKDIANVQGLEKLSVDLPKIETPAGDVNVGQVTEQAKQYTGDIKNISQGNLNEVKALPETLEQQAVKAGGLEELQKQSGVMDDYKGKLEPLKDPNAAKEKGVEIAKKAAVDHFAGKEEQVKAAMEKMAKYKRKYSSVQSIKDLPKRPPNAMKGKPFIERVVPGLYFQYQQKHYNLFDLNPYLGYRISGRFTSGIGWNERIAYDRNRNNWNKVGRIWGPRAYTDFKLGKGFNAHLETELMNAFVPSTIHGNPDAGQRKWVWGMMTGMKKEYKIYGNLRGTVLIQYNIFDRKHEAPYADRLNSRIGVEWRVRKREEK